MSCAYCKKETCDITPVECRDCGYWIFSFQLCDECHDIYHDTEETPRCEKCEDVLTFEIEQAEKEFEIEQAEKEEQVRELLGVKQCKPVPTDDDVFDDS